MPQSLLMPANAGKRRMGLLWLSPYITRTILMAS